MAKKYLYKFLMDGMKSRYDGSEWKVGEWRGVPKPKEECVGLNASEHVQDALNYVQGTVLARVECGGKIIKGSDKWTCERMRLVAVAPWGKRESVELAIRAAELVLPKWTDEYPNDDRPAEAIRAAKEWLKTGKISSTYVAYAAYAAASAAAHVAYAAAHVAYAASAAYAAASAAYAAAYAAAHAVYAVYAASAAYSAYAAAAAAAYAAAAAAAAGAKREIHRYALTLAKWGTV